MEMVVGFQTPVIPLSEIDDKGGTGVAPKQSGPIGLKVGVDSALTIKLPAAFTAPQPPSKGIW